MVLNLGVIALAALLPILVGFIWYNPKVFGKAWMNACEFKEEGLKGANMALILGLCYVLSYLLGIMITMIVIHQNHFYSLLADIPVADIPEMGSLVIDFTEKLGGLYRNFGHGAFHGVLAALFFAMPVIGINGLFERKSFKYIAIHVGYWTTSLGLMGGVICQFS